MPDLSIQFLLILVLAMVQTMEIIKIVPLVFMTSYEQLEKTFNNLYIQMQNTKSNESIHKEFILKDIFLSMAFSEFRGSLRYVLKGQLTYLLKVDMILQD